MQFEDINDTVYSALQYEFEAEYIRTNKQWSDFIKDKDIGIQYFIKKVYTIVDQKKWLLAKIKYGL